MAPYALGPPCCTDTPQSPPCHSTFSFCSEGPNTTSRVFLPTWPGIHPSVWHSHRGSRARVWDWRTHGLGGRTSPPHSNGNITVHSRCSGLCQPSTSWGLPSSWMTTSDRKGPPGHPRPLQPPPPCPRMPANTPACRVFGSSGPRALTVGMRESTCEGSGWDRQDSPGNPVDKQPASLFHSQAPGPNRPSLLLNTNMGKTVKSRSGAHKPGPWSRAGCQETVSGAKSKILATNCGLGYGTPLPPRRGRRQARNRPPGRLGPPHHTCRR